MEKHYLTLSTLGVAPCVHIEVVNESGVHLSQITVFYVKFVKELRFRSSLAK